MKREVDKLARNLLVSGRPVSLPGVGALRVVRYGAERLPHRRITPPGRRVEFSSQEQEPSLVDFIARAASCSATQAREVYDRWLDKSREGEAIVIGGVGSLMQKSFLAEASFDALLNPQGHEPVRLKRRRDGWLWAVSTVAVCVAVVCAGVMGGVIPDPFHPAVSSSVAEQTVSSICPTAPATLSEPVADTVAEWVEAKSEDEGAAIAVQTVATSEPEPDGAIHYSQPGRRYVVLGIFSTEQNARSAVAQAVKKDSASACRIYHYADKYMVSLFESSDTEPAQKFVRAHRETFRDIWVYTKR